MNKLQQLMYNEGERLVPYVSHGDNELIRHRSSYAFFHKVIQNDLDLGLTIGPVSIADLGFGTGFGCALLASIPGSRILGVDNGPECEIYSRQYYERKNVEYIIQDLNEYVPEMETFDYVVSRGVLEHVPRGLDLIQQLRFTKRVMIDVPYDEKPGNPHHTLVGIKENAFKNLAGCEFLYEDLEGNIYDSSRKPDRPNLILVVLSAPGLASISSLLDFPFRAVKDSALERLSEPKEGGKKYILSRDSLLDEAAKAVRETKTVADIGCGIMPMNYFRPGLHIMIEPWREYADILAKRFEGDKSILILELGALEALRALKSRSIDSIFLLDVIEHLEKNDGFEVIAECERVAREQIILFTPLGFMEQHIGDGEKDGWGLSGATVQRHLSGWTPDDFGENWSFYICDDFHQINFKHEALAKNHGAFFAIRSFSKYKEGAPHLDNELRRPLPSEIEAEQLRVSNVILTKQLADSEEGREALARLMNAREAEFQSHIYKLYSKVIRFIRLLRS